MLDTYFVKLLELSYLFHYNLWNHRVDQVVSLLITAIYKERISEVMELTEQVLRFGETKIIKRGALVY